MLDVLRNSDVFKSYDIRGVLSVDFVRSLGRRFAGRYGDVVVMTDPKESSKFLSWAFAKGVNEAGFNVTHCGVGPTDMCALAGAYFGRVSVMFTASHLSDGFDGIKFHDCKGLPFSSVMIEGLKLLSDCFNGGGVTECFDFFEIYAGRALSRYRELFSHDLAGLRVLVDVKGGCAVSPVLLRRLGAFVDVVNSRGSDSNNDSGLAVRVRDYDLVLVHDFDADRVLLVSESGVINGSLIACMLTDVLKGVVVASIDTSQVLGGFAKVVYSRVGDPFVTRAVVDCNACLGVEFSGHFTDPCFALTSSGSFFALLIAGLAFERGVRERLSVLPRADIVLDKVVVSDKDSFMLSVMERVNVNDIISEVDGVKFFFKGRVAIVRPSGTENIVRFYLENPDGVVINDLINFFTGDSVIVNSGVNVLVSKQSSEIKCCPVNKGANATCCPEDKGARSAT